MRLCEKHGNVSDNSNLLDCEFAGIIDIYTDSRGIGSNYEKTGDRDFGTCRCR